MPADKSGLLLVVDDNPATRYATTRVLRHAGFAVREAATGGEGVHIATEAPIDLVVLDIDLPDIDGYEVCRRIRAMPSTQRVRVVYLSASFVDDSHKVEGFQAGADGFLTHPVEPAVLNATVASLLRTRAIEVELEQLLEREREARAEAERANRAKDDFLATLSHELRSPLTAIVGWAEVARLKAESHPDIVAAVDIIMRNARLQSQLISDLLDVSRITTGAGLRLDSEPVSLSDVVHTSIESMASAAAQRRITFECAIATHVFVNGDAGRLAQIVSNLLSNAVKFSPPGAPVHVTLAPHEGRAQLTVVDKGRGIGPSVLPRVFDRFWQEDTTSRRSYSGLGLGLSIVRHLAAMHGGTVVAASEGEGRGAQFTVTLPMLEGGARAALPLEVMPDGAIDLRETRVLIVDDDTDGRAWVRHVLATAGADVLDVSDVSLALEALAVFRPHVVVSDLAMPVRNGFDFLESLRASESDGARLPVIAMSAFASADDRRRALNAGFQYFVAKPPRSQELLRLVRRAAG